MIRHSRLAKTPAFLGGGGDHQGDPGTRPQAPEPGGTHAILLNHCPFLDRPATQMASTSAGVGGTSAPLTAITLNLPSREPNTAPARPCARLDPPLTPFTDHLPLPSGSRVAHEDSETPTDLAASIEESAQDHEGPCICVGYDMEVDTRHAPTLDPDVGAVQWDIRGCSRLQSWGHSLTQMAMWRSQRLAKTLVGLPQTGHSIGPVCGRSTTVPDDRQRCAFSLEPRAHPHTP